MYVRQTFKKSFFDFTCHINYYNIMYKVILSKTYRLTSSYETYEGVMTKMRLTKEIFVCTRISVLSIIIQF